MNEHEPAKHLAWSPCQIKSPRQRNSSYHNGMARCDARRILMCTIFMVAVGVTGPASGQISPGPLARAHHALEGPANCTRCHTASVRSRSFLCLDCHREIAAELQQHKGLHATYSQAGAPGAACVKCHSDHNGENFAIVHWTPTASGFDHVRTGYALDGKHAGVACRDCHNARHIADSARGLLQQKDLDHTYLGLVTRCAACHGDKHLGRFGTDCARCHSTEDWHKTRLDTQAFDHATTRFPLNGLHRQVACEKCHVNGADGRPRYTGIPFATCGTCHADPHKGEFKQDCGECHSTSTWKKSQFESQFDHSRTHFPLLGLHLQVQCVSCHTAGDFKSPIAHAQCSDCHRPDPHGGQFAAHQDGGRCEACHTVTGWKPSTFGAADHARTGFPLVRPHDRVECAKCHVPAGTQTRFKIKYAACTDCHTDVHEGQFAGAPWLNRCDKCHAGATFKVSNYTLALHRKSRLPLTGGHVAVACDQCHNPLTGSTTVRFHFNQLACTTCHEDVHQGQFSARMTVHMNSGEVAGCEACHSTKDWHDVSRFNHETTRFPLVGTHRAVACIECHRPRNLERTMLHVRFSDASTQCDGCHENPHSNQFGAQAYQCAACHNTHKWRPSLFDHEKTSFSLKGGHQDVACSACHLNKRAMDGVVVLFYKPTPKECADCHTGGVPKTKTSRANPVLPRNTDAHQYNKTAG
jgi:Cytochrome c7 and related cytochrome c